MWILAGCVSETKDEYFIDAYPCKPSKEILVEMNGLSEPVAEFLLEKGGGRISDERAWYKLVQFTIDHESPWTATDEILLQSLAWRKKQHCEQQSASQDFFKLFKVEGV